MNISGETWLTHGKHKRTGGLVLTLDGGQHTGVVANYLQNLLCQCRDVQYFMQYFTLTLAFEAAAKNFTLFSVNVLFKICTCRVIKAFFNTIPGHSINVDFVEELIMQYFI